MTDDLIERLRGYCDGNNDLMDAAADRIEKLEAALNCNLPDYDPEIGVVARLRQLGKWTVGGTKSSPIYNKSADRIEALEAALREIIQEDALNGKTVFVGDFGKIARKALEGKDG